VATIARVCFSFLDSSALLYFYLLNAVFAYGATGAGKTHTMLGTPSEPGVTPLLMQELYDTLLQESSDVDVAVSYLEIYNENVILCFYYVISSYH